MRQILYCTSIQLIDVSFMVYPMVPVLNWLNESLAASPKGSYDKIWKTNLNTELALWDEMASWNSQKKRSDFARNQSLNDSWCHEATIEMIAFGRFWGTKKLTLRMVQQSYWANWIVTYLRPGIPKCNCLRGKWGCPLQFGLVYYIYLTFYPIKK